MRTDLDERAREATELAAAVATLFAGRDQGVIGTVLADITAMWVACHRSSDGKERTDQLREELLALHLGNIRRLIPANEKFLPEDREC